MATTIRTAPRQRADTPFPAALRDLLPERLKRELSERLVRGGHPEELRLRCDRRASLTVGGRNVFLDTVLSRAEMDGILNGMCDGSLYAHRDALANGYLTLPEGIRVGVCGRAAVERGSVIGIYDIVSLNIRFPAAYRGFGAPICRLLRRSGRGAAGVLIYAPPGVGKTTLLRCVAAQMASGEEPWRVAVIDTRGELGYSLQETMACLDVLTGYPREVGIEIATRTLNAQLIVCDEIGEREEAWAILSAQNCGVPFVASAHADCVEGLLRREGLLTLHRAKVFGAYVGIRRSPLGGDYTYSITDWEAANGMAQGSGRVDTGT